jgi:hypothetical protein
MTHLLAYTPFIDPLNLHRVWYVLIVPLAFGVAIVHKAIRVGDMKHYPRQVVAMTLQVVGSMAALGLVSYLLIQHIIPRILPVQ